MATLSQMGIPGSGNGILAPKLKNRWQVRFIGIAKAANGNGKDLTAQAVTVSRPSLSFEEVKLDRYNSTAYVAGKHSWEPLNLTVEDDITGLAATVVQQQLEGQQRLIGADSSSGQWLNAEPTASGYKFALKLELLDGNEGVVETWKLEGCFIQAADWGELDYSASEAAQISLTIRFDHAYQEVAGQGYGTAIGGHAT
jgi:hypothetical protein